jgi:hypothetical protein
MQALKRKLKKLKRKKIKKGEKTNDEKIHARRTRT